jgi:hypothetical protein
MDSAIQSGIKTKAEVRRKSIAEAEEVDRNSSIEPEERLSQAAVRAAAADAAKEIIETKAAKEEKLVQDKARRDSIGELKAMVEKRETKEMLRKMTEEEQAFEKLKQKDVINGAAAAAAAKKEADMAVKVKSNTDNSIQEAVTVARRKSMTS